MRRTSSVRPVENRPVFVLAGWIAALCVILLAGHAVAQQPPGQKSKSASAESKREVKRVEGVNQQPSVSPKAKLEDPRRDKKTAKGQSLTPDPDAHWACAQLVLDVGDIWSGDQTKFVFKIKNEGTSDLRLKARGG